jgi:hypothetical protein
MGGGKQKKEKGRGVRAAPRKPAPRAKTATGDIRAFFGVLAGKSRKMATIEEINEATAACWAKGGSAGLTCASDAQSPRSMKDLRLDGDPSRTGCFEPGSKVSSFKREPF